MPITITNFSLTEGNPAVSALVPAYTYLRDRSIVNFSFTCTWSGASKVTGIEPTVGIYNSATTSQQFAWLFAKEEKTSATSGTRTYSGQMFAPQLTSGFGPGLTSLADGNYWIKFNFSAFNGSSGVFADSKTIAITFATAKAPSAELFDVYRATSAGARSDEGTYIRYSIRASVFPVLSTDRGTFTLRYRRSGTSTWSTVSLGSNVQSINVSATQLPSTYPVSTSCELELVITDRYTTATIPKLIPTASVLMHFREDKTGIGIGKYSEISGTFDVGLPTRFRQSVTLDQPLALSPPLAKASGGLGSNVSTQDAMLSAIGIRVGTATTTVAVNSAKELYVSFSPAFSSAPRFVTATLILPLTSVLAYGINVYVGTITANGCYLYINRPNGSGTATANLCWMAVQ